MLDLTREIQLNEKWKRPYFWAKFIVFIIFLLVGLFVLHKILFPSAYFEFFFDTPNANKNTIISPHKKNGELYQNGKIFKNDMVIFDTGVIGNFSNSKITLSLEKDYYKKLEGTVKARKSYQSFFYPEGDPIGFKNGMLLKYSSDYYIVSNDKLRKFSAENVLTQLGFNKEAFVETSLDDLSKNLPGENITQSSVYPDETLFNVSEEYYQLKRGKLFQFVSEKAYLTRYAKNQAIEKDLVFLDDYELSEDFIGFNDGTLLAFDISVFVVSGNKAHPINNPRTFESMGYAWDDVISVNSEEIGIYEQEKLFTLSSPHPDGTIFKTTDSGKYYYIEKGYKREIPKLNIVNSYLKSSPIEVEEESLEKYAVCEIKPILRIFGKYGCDISIENIITNKGNDFKFEVDLKREIEAKKLETNFHQVLSIENMKESLSILKGRILNNYTL